MFPPHFFPFPSHSPHYFCHFCCTFLHLPLTCCLHITLSFLSFPLSYFPIFSHISLPFSTFLYSFLTFFPGISPHSPHISLFSHFFSRISFLHVSFPHISLFCCRFSISPTFPPLFLPFPSNFTFTLLSHFFISYVPHTPLTPTPRSARTMAAHTPPSRPLHGQAAGARRPNATLNMAARHTQDGGSGREEASGAARAQDGSRRGEGRWRPPRTRGASRRSTSRSVP